MSGKVYRENNQSDLFTCQSDHCQPLELLPRPIGISFAMRNSSPDFPKVVGVGNGDDNLRKAVRHRPPDSI
jgi:hypothetical protein